MSSTICSFLWKHVCIRNGALRQPCCEFNEEIARSSKLAEPVDPENLRASLNDEFFREMRRKALSGETIPGCEKCYVQEKKEGLWSSRQSANMDHKLTGNETVESELDQIEFLEIFLGDECNLKCLICHPSLSTTWRADYQKLGWGFAPRITHRPDYAKIIVQLPSLRIIKFVGGEPLITPGHEAILAAVPDEVAKRTRLIYNSNGTKIPGAALVKLWEKFGHIDFRVSVDGYGIANEYARFPSKWADTERNLRYFFGLNQRMPNFVVGIQNTTSAYTVFSVSELLSWFLKLRNEFGLSDNPKPWINFSPLNGPKHFSIRHMSAKNKEKALRKLDVNNHHLRMIVAALHSDGEDLTKEFLEYTLPLDRIRGNSLFNAVPELEDLNPQPPNFWRQLIRGAKNFRYSGITSSMDSPRSSSR